MKMAALCTTVICVIRVENKPLGYHVIFLFKNPRNKTNKNSYEHTVGLK